MRNRNDSSFNNIDDSRGDVDTAVVLVVARFHRNGAIQLGNITASKIMIVGSIPDSEISKNINAAFGICSTRTEKI